MRRLTSEVITVRRPEDCRLRGGALGSCTVAYLGVDSMMGAYQDFGACLPSVGDLAAAGQLRIGWGR
jgi:hypothetical protein